MKIRYRNIIFIVVVFVVFALMWALIGNQFLVEKKVNKEQNKMVREIYPVLNVQEVQKNIDFYKNLGFKVLMRHPQTGDMETALMEIGRSKLLIKKLVGKPKCLTELYFDVEGIEEVFEEIKKDFEIQDTIKKTNYGTKEFSVEDLNGNTLYFSEMIY